MAGAEGVEAAELVFEGASVGTRTDTGAETGTGVSRDEEAMFVTFRVM